MVDSSLQNDEPPVPEERPVEERPGRLETLDECLEEELELSDHAVDLLPAENEVYVLPIFQYTRGQQPAGQRDGREEIYGFDIPMPEADILSAAADTPRTIAAAQDTGKNVLIKAPDSQSESYEGIELKEWFKRPDGNVNPFKFGKEGGDQGTGLTYAFLRRIRDYVNVEDTKAVLGMGWYQAGQ